MPSLVENPDHVNDTGNDYWEKSAFPFGYYKGKFLMGKPGGIHGGMEGGVFSRSMFKIPGRVWKNTKVISLWTYPTTVSTWRRLLSDVSSRSGIPVKQLKLELVPGQKITSGSKRFKDDFGGQGGLIVNAGKFVDAIEKHKMKIQQRSSGELSKAHMMSPLAKGVRNVPAGVGSKKRPAGLTHTQYRQKMSTSESMNESPDGVSGLNPYAKDAFPFGYYKGKFYFTRRDKPGERDIQTHWGMGDAFIDDRRGSYEWRNEFKYAGRIWVNWNLFSLWKYPTTKNGWKKLTDDIVRAFSKFGISKSNLHVELKTRSGNKAVKLQDVLDKFDSKTSKPDIGQRSSSEMGKAHVMSPLAKRQRNVPTGVGSKKRPAGMSYSKWRQMMSTSESIITLEDVLTDKEI